LLAVSLLLIYNHKHTENADGRKAVENYDVLKIENQLCFPLYAAARELMKLYRPYLEEIDLTYTQYIAMLVMWEKGGVSVRDLGRKLHLDSGTLTPVLKSLEAKGLVKRYRCSSDERVLIVEPSEKGLNLKDAALNIPEQMAAYVKLTQEETAALYSLLYKLLDKAK